MVRLGLVTLMVSLALFATSTSGRRTVVSDEGENSIDGFDNSGGGDGGSGGDRPRPHHGKGKKKVKISSPGGNGNDGGGGGGDAGPDVNRPPVNLPLAQPSPAPSALDVKNSTINPEDAEYLPGGPSTFTVTSSEVGLGWTKLPWRERYQWADPNAPCLPFKLQVPDERSQFSTITLCIYRTHLEYQDDTDQFIRREEEETELIGELKEQKVHGYVVGQNGSAVYGKIVGTSFYGEVAVYDWETKEEIVYEVEEIKLLKKLMRHNEKILRNILAVMSRGGNGARYNAVVTKGASLINFMAAVNPSEFVRGSFLVFSTNRNSYITAGEPQMEVDDDGVITFNAGGDKIIIDNEGHPAIHLKTGTEREYVFRPNGKTIVQDGNDVVVLEEHEGAVAVSAFSADNSYGCILPTPAFSPQRPGGYLCKVCLAVDKLFLEKYMSFVSPPIRPAPFLARILDNVSWIFRSTDWNGDGTPDNIGLDYDRQNDNWIYIDSGEESLEHDELDMLYGNLARMDFSDCCVAITYTMKRFPGAMFAKSANGNDKRINAHNGVCGGQDQAGLSDNVILISANSKKGNFSRMSEDQLTYLTAQQIGRAFGAAPDGSGDDSCDIFKDAEGTERHFLMWPDVLRNYSMEEKVPSKCSKLQVTKILSQCKSACFDIDKHPFCGNGIVEEGEECDCGGEADCAKQKCCYSRLGLHPCRKSGISCKKSGATKITTMTFPAIVATLLAALFLTA